MTAATQTLETVYAVLEWVFRALFILVTILQMIIRGSSTGLYCRDEVGLLREEGNWLGWLIGVQIVKVFVMSVWHLVLNRRRRGFFSDQFSLTNSTSSSYYDQSTVSLGRATSLTSKSGSANLEQD